MTTESLMKPLPPPLPNEERAIDPLIYNTNTTLLTTSFELQIDQHTTPQQQKSNATTPQYNKQCNTSNHNLSVTSSGGALSTTSTSSNGRFSAIRNWLKQNRWRKHKDGNNKHVLVVSTTSPLATNNATTPVSNKHSLLSSLTSPFQHQHNFTNLNKKSNSENHSNTKQTGLIVSTPTKAQINSKFFLFCFYCIQTFLTHLIWIYDDLFFFCLLFVILID